MMEEKRLKIKKNVEKMTDLRKESEKLRKEQELNIGAIKENREKINDLRMKIKKNMDKIEEMIEIKKKHERNIKFKRKHRVLNKVSGFLHVFGFPTYSIANSEYEIRKADDLILALEKENETFNQKVTMYEDRNKLLYEENDVFIEKINKIYEELELKSKENEKLEKENEIVIETEQENKTQNTKEQIREIELTRKLSVARKNKI